MPALKAILVKIDEVDEKYRDLYTERNGKWEFTGVEGLKTQGDVDRIQEAHKKTRADLAKAQTDLKAVTDKLTVWEELDPVEVKGKLEKLETYEAGNSVPELAKNFEATVAARVAQVVDGKVKTETTKLSRALEDAQKKLLDTTNQVTEYVQKDHQRTVHDAVRSAAVASKVIPEAIGDLLVVAGTDLKLVDGKVVTEDGRDPAAWLEDRKQKTPYFWPSAQGAGSQNDRGGPGGIGGDNPFRRDSWNMTKGAQLVQSNPAQAAKLAEQAGVPKNPDGTFQYHVMPAEKK